MASRKCERRAAPGWILCINGELPKHMPPDTQFHIRTHSEVDTWRRRGCGVLLEVWTNPAYAASIRSFKDFTKLHSYKIYKGEPSS